MRGWSLLRRRRPDRPSDGPVLRDPETDRQLAEHGYVVVELLTVDEVEELSSAWSSVGSEHPPVWDPTGLATTLRHPGADLAADRAIRPVITRACARITVDRVPFMSAFVVKEPEGGALPAHLDWTMLDDPAVRTFGCWAPLTEATEDRGQLGVVPGSHLLVDFERSPEHPGHDWTEELLSGGARTVLLPVPIGHAVLYDHRLVHSSTPNASTRPRVAVNSALARSSEAEAARRRLLDMTARGMSGAGGEPQIPDLDERTAEARPPS